jgi:hypothetical protein
MSGKEGRNMKERLIFLILSMFLIISCAAQNTQQVPPTVQEKCEAPLFMEGDSWKFIDEGGHQWEETIIKKDTTLDLRQTPNKGFHGIFSFPFVGRKLFPLWVGKKYEGVEIAQSVEGISLNYNYSYRILGIVDEKVQGGTFKCYKIEFKVSHSSQEGVLYLYYSPEAKSIIKSQTNSQLLYKFTNYELVSYEHQKTRLN